MTMMWGVMSSDVGLTYQGQTVVGQFLHTNGIYCVLLAINSSKQRKDNQSRTLPMVSSECVTRYCDLFTMETKKLSFFSSAQQITTFHLIF